MVSGGGDPHPQGDFSFLSLPHLKGKRPVEEVGRGVGAEKGYGCFLIVLRQKRNLNQTLTFQ